jgi:hypothetical protein
VSNDTIFGTCATCGHRVTERAAVLARVSGTHLPCFLRIFPTPGKVIRDTILSETAEERTSDELA